MDRGKPEAIKSFLLGVKYATLPWIMLRREKNETTKFELDLTDEDIREEIFGLSVNDYCEGPCKDKEIEGDVWIFGKTIREKEVYIKLKLTGDEKGQGVRIISFHFPDKPLRYLYKK